MARAQAGSLFCVAIFLGTCCGSVLAGRTANGSCGGPIGSCDAEEKSESGLMTSLRTMLLGEPEDFVEAKLGALQAQLRATFSALPKDSSGRLGPRAVRHLVHNHFSLVRGWFVRGFEPTGMRAKTANLHEVAIVQERSALLRRSLLTAKQSSHGFSLEEATAFIAILERLVIHDSIDLLDAAYRLNNASTTDSLGNDDLHRVLLSYLLVLRGGSSVDTANVTKHHLSMDRQKKLADEWTAMTEFVSGTTQNMFFTGRHEANPFVEPSHNYGTAWQAVEQLMKGFGKWQDRECGAMRGILTALDHEGSGRISLKAFHSQPRSVKFRFDENIKSLRQVGALDESRPGHPAVLIANYVEGPTNCVSIFNHFSVCCLSQCPVLMRKFEGAIRGPAATPEILLGIARNLSASFAIPDRKPAPLRPALVHKLEEIGERHGGMVPIHGRLFSQWLHYAFPNTCPYPHVIESNTGTAPHKFSASMASTPYEKKKSAKTSAHVPDVLAMTLWSDDEVLPLDEEEWRGSGTWSELAEEYAGYAVQLLAAIAGIRVAMVVCRSLWRVGRKKYKNGRARNQREQDIDFELLQAAVDVPVLGRKQNHALKSKASATAASSTHGKSGARGAATSSASLNSALASTTTGAPRPPKASHRKSDGKSADGDARAVAASTNSGVALRASPEVSVKAVPKTKQPRQLPVAKDAKPVPQSSPAGESWNDASTTLSDMISLPSGDSLSEDEAPQTQETAEDTHHAGIANDQEALLGAKFIEDNLPEEPDARVCAKVVENSLPCEPTKPAKEASRMTPSQWLGPSPPSSPKAGDKFVMVLETLKDHFNEPETKPFHEVSSKHGEPAPRPFSDDVVEAPFGLLAKQASHSLPAFSGIGPPPGLGPPPPGLGGEKTWWSAADCGAIDPPTEAPPGLAQEPHFHDWLGQQGTMGNSSVSGKDRMSF